MSEQDILNAILDYLRLIGAVAIRVNAGVRIIEDANGSRRAFRGAPAGCPDIICCYRGRFIGVEVKAEKGLVSPNQARFHEIIRDAGGIVVVARGIGDVIDALKEGEG